MWIESILNRRILPAWFVRIAVRLVLWISRKRYQNSSIEVRQRQKMDLLKEFNERPIAILPDDANLQHYEVPSGFFSLVLGPWLKYSCCYWSEGVNDLDAAEEAMLKLTCERARLTNGLRVLDLGCGWGSLSLWIATHYPDCHVTAFSNSTTQGVFIRQQAAARGLTNIEVRTGNVANVAFDPIYDRVLSIEMFEHMKNYEHLLRKIAAWMKPSGLLFVHHFSHRERSYEFDVNDPYDIMARKYFAGGTMPSDDLLLYFQRDLHVLAHWRVSGLHYKKTLRAWLDQLRKKRRAVYALFRETLDQAGARQQFTHWENFFLICEETFKQNAGREYFVSHLLLQKKNHKLADGCEDQLNFQPLTIQHGKRARLDGTPSPSSPCGRTSRHLSQRAIEAAR